MSVVRSRSRPRSRSLGTRVLRAAVLLAVSGVLSLPLAGNRVASAGTTLAPAGWSKVSDLPPTFTSRWNFSLAYYPPTDQVVVFGGAPKAPGETFKNDTWIYTNNAWIPGPAAPAGLTPRGGAAMAYDPAIAKIVLFGGQTAPSGTSWAPSNQTWLYNGSSWTQGPTAPAGLAGRVGARMVYDPAIGKIVMFGGSGLDIYTDTWLFDGTAWTQGPTAPGGMLPREFFGMTYDLTLGKVVVAGGDGASDVWYFNGTAWTAGPPMPAAMGPKERIYMDYDVQLKGDVVFGSVGPGLSNDDVWVLRDGAWVKVGQAATPTWPDARVEGAVLWHPVAQAMMVFSGIDDGGGTLGTVGLTDTWFLNLPLTVDPGQPGLNDPVSGYGYDANEPVDFKIDSATGATIASTVADASGQFVRIQVPLPIPLAGGSHFMYAVGRTSGVALKGAFTVTPVGTLSEKQLGSGDTTVYQGNGFKVGETVTAYFPGGTHVTQVASAVGAVNITLTMPNEPWPGGNVTGSAPSGTTLANYTVLDRVTGPAAAHSGTSYTITLSGYKASEKVTLTWADQGSAFITLTVGTNGYLSTSVKLVHANGGVKINSKGLTSGQTATSASVKFT